MKHWETQETIELAQTNQNSLYSEKLYKWRLLGCKENATFSQLLFPLQNRENDRSTAILLLQVGNG